MSECYLIRGAISSSVTNRCIGGGGGEVKIAIFALRTF